MKTPLQVAIKLEERLERLHDALNETLGERHKLTDAALQCYGLCTGIVYDLEKANEDDS